MVQIDNLEASTYPPKKNRPFWDQAKDILSLKTHIFGSAGTESRVNVAHAFWKLSQTMTRALLKIHIFHPTTLQHQMGILQAQNMGKIWVK